MRERGFTFLELAATLAVLMVVLIAAGPRYRVAVEHTKVDRCAGVLRSIWHAQRMHWLETRSYADSLPVLVAAGELDAAVADATDPFSYRIAFADAETFLAEGMRAGPTWSGTLTMTASGVLSGHVADTGGRRVEAPAK